MAALNASGQDRQLVLLLTHEKTVRYAQNQIAQGELLAGKAILDGVVRQLAKQDHQDSQAITQRRDALFQCIAGIREEIAQARIKRVKGRNPTENA